MKEAKKDANSKNVVNPRPFENNFPADRSFSFEAMAPLLADLKLQLALRQAMA